MAQVNRAFSMLESRRPGVTCRDFPDGPGDFQEG